MSRYECHKQRRKGGAGAQVPRHASMKLMDFQWCSLVHSKTKRSVLSLSDHQPTIKMILTGTKALWKLMTKESVLLVCNCVLTRWVPPIWSVFQNRHRYRNALLLTSKLSKRVGSEKMIISTETSSGRFLLARLCFLRRASSCSQSPALVVPPSDPTFHVSTWRRTTTNWFRQYSTLTDCMQ